MAKRFKLRISIPSFQLCRSKNLFSLSFPKTYYLFSPINSRIAYPNSPDPPPTTPTNNHHNHHNPFFKPHHSSKITPLTNIDSQLKPHKTCNSPNSFDSDDADLPISPPPLKQKRREKLSIQETESVFSSSTSFDASSIDLSNYSGSKASIKNVKPRKLKRYASNKWKLGMMTSTTESSPGFRGLMPPPPSAVEGKVKESFAVVAKSEDPYEDFKRSMMEMILEKQMFEVKELEELLHCFLSLNSRHHHAVIVAAFTEIWEALFL